MIGIEAQIGRLEVLGLDGDRTIAIETDRVGLRRAPPISTASKAQGNVPPAWTCSIVNRIRFPAIPAGFET